MTRYWNLAFFPSVIVLVAINLRPVLASLSPLLDVIQYDTGLSDTDAGLLTTLPVALMGFCLLCGSRLRSLIGERNGITAGLGLIGLAGLGRWMWPQAVAMMATAILGGVGIALVQAFMPSVIRRQAGARTANLMGLYSTGIMGGALISSVTSPWIAQAFGWPTALGLWSLLAVLGFTAWGKWPVSVNARRVPLREQSLYRVQRAWLLLSFFGLGTGAYTLVLAWLPPFYTHLGWSAQAAGMLLGGVTFAEVLAGIAVSLWIHHCPDRRMALFAAIGALLAGLLCLCLAPLTLVWPAAVLAGLGIGALFPLSLIVAMDHGEQVADAGAIAEFVQGGGYVIAALLPLMAGILRQTLTDLTPAWWLMAGLCLVMMLMAVRFQPQDRISFPS